MPSRPGVRTPKARRAPPWAPRFRDLPLFAKLLVPFLALMLFVGAFGVFLMVRDLGSRAQASLDQDLAGRSLDARSVLRDRELYLLESANFAANLDGVAQAVERGDREGVARLVQSVVVLKSDLSLVAVTDHRGVGLVEFTRTTPTEPITRADGTAFSEQELVGRALGAADGATKHAGFLSVGGRDMLAIVAPVCTGPESCSVGTAIVGISVDELAAAAHGQRGPSDAPDPRGATGIALYDADGRLITRSGNGPTEATLPDDRTRRVHTVGEVEVTTVYTPFEVQGSEAGTLAVSIPTEQAFAAARGAGLRLALILFGAMIGVVGIGAVLSRRILGQVRPLVETNRALGRGELEARAPVLSSDELGELAHGVNQMAEQLQASYEALELRVAQRTEEIQRLLKERTEFFAALSHEFRTPLAVIRGQAKMMLDPSYPKNPKTWLAETGRVIDDSAGQLLSLVNDVLDLARAEAGRLEVDLETLDLSDVVGDVRPTIEGLARGSDLRMEVHLQRGLPSVRADRARLREVIVNLVDNAVKYTPEGGKVELSARARNGSVLVSVADTGVGIPQESGELIFEPFYRVRGTTAQRGQASSGLGLAIAKRIVEAQGGTITFESEPGVGTTFTFTLVRTKPAKARRTRSRSTRR